MEDGAVLVAAGLSWPEAREMLKAGQGDVFEAVRVLGGAGLVAGGEDGGVEQEEEEEVDPKP